MRLLLLGGTQEARQIASALRDQVGLALSVSLARGERRPISYGCPVRIGGWGGEAEYSAWLESEGVDAVLDATHPFAGEMAHRAARVSSAQELDHMRVVRPPWLPRPEDQWSFLNSEKDAADHIPAGETVFLATGRDGLDGLERMQDRRIICRVKDLPPTPFPGKGMYLADIGPYSVAGERHVMERFGVTWLMTRNSGGRGSWPKLEAARHLGLKVAMIRRPPQPDCMRVSTVAEALSWVRRRL